MRSGLFKLVVVCCALVGGVLLSGAGFAESLYVTDHSTNVFCFDVINGALEFRGSLGWPNLQDRGITLEIDNDHHILFRIVEDAFVIELIDAKTLDLIETVTLSVNPDAGIVYDAANSRLLCTKRDSNILYVLSWTPATRNLALAETIQLANIEKACDLAIDGNTLYVSEYYYGGFGGSAPTYKEIYAYDMSNNFAFIEKINMGDYVVSIDYNAADDSIYAGAYIGHQKILKRTFAPSNLTDGDIGTAVTGIATNGSRAGQVFVTTYRNVPGYGIGTIEWWDMSSSYPNDYELVFAYSNDNADGVTLSGLAGLVVGEDFIEPQLILEKSHNATGCVSPGDDFVYSICWQNDTIQTAEDVYIVDYLPEQVTYEGAIWATDPNLDILPPEPGYHENAHAFVFDVDDIPAGSSGCVQLDVTVNDKAEPEMNLYNVATITSSLGTYTVDLSEPSICRFDTAAIIYVDKNAHGNNNGTSWSDAYTNLHDALRRAANSTYESDYSIYVAQETYLTGDSTVNSFHLSEGCRLYGGFPTGGGAFNLRNPERYETILSGQIDEYTRADTVVTMGHKSLLDGFTVTQSADYGIYGSGVDFEVENCTIIDNERYGVYAIDGNVTVKWCDLNNNQRYGVFHQGTGFTLTVENCRIRKNNEYGIACSNSTPIIKNSIVSENDLAGAGNEGIFIVNPTYPPILHNNTIALNRAEGIFFTDNETVSDPNEKDWPDVQNCILWYNNNDNGQYAGFDISHISFSCVYDPNNDPNGENYNLDPNNFNFSGNPKFAYITEPNNLPSPDNMHIAYNSFCKDKGNPDESYIHQVDMDKQLRVVDGLVDVGAYEVRCGEVSHTLDWNTDGLVNLEDFSEFQKAWFSYDPNHPSPPNDPNAFINWNSSCDLVEDLHINLADLIIFCEDNPQNWLWKACWVGDYDCFDSSNVLDWDEDGDGYGDGLVNMVEFSLFAQVWDANRPPEPDANWEFWNLDDTGDSADKINLADLMEFVNNWLWVACWKEIDDGCTNPLDWNDDGFVNYEEFSRFQAAWLSQDGGLNWNPVCDLDDSGAIDMGDVMIFLNDWLWISCEQRALMTVPQQDDPLQVLSEEVSQLQTNIGLLDTLWQTDPNMQQQFTAEEWQVFMDTLYEELTTKTRTLYELQTGMSMIDQVLGLQSDIVMLEDLWLTDPDIQQQIDPADWQTLMDALYEQLDVLMDLLTEEEMMFLEMLGGQTQAATAAPEAMTMLLAEPATLTETDAFAEDPVVQLADNIELLETIWAEDDQIKEVIDTKDWKEFMDTVYDELEHLESLQGVQ